MDLIMAVKLYPNAIIQLIVYDDKKGSTFINQKKIHGKYLMLILS